MEQQIQRHTEKARKRMSALAPLVDEVLLADAEEHSDGFKVEEIIQEIREVFVEKGENSFACLGFYEWSDLIRGRCSVLNFELHRQPDGESRWVKREGGSE